MKSDNKLNITIKSQLNSPIYNGIQIIPTPKPSLTEPGFVKDGGEF